MKTQTIRISKADFEKVVAGKKKVITCEITPENSKKYVFFSDMSTHVDYTDWSQIPDGAVSIKVEPKEFDSVKLTGGGGKGPLPSCTAQIKGAEVIFLVDDQNEQVFYDVDGIDFPGLVVDYELGKITHN